MEPEVSTDISNLIRPASRRDVIKTITAGSAALLFSPHSLLAATRQRKERLGVALVGLGYYSTDLLAPALQQTKLLPRRHCYRHTIKG